MEFIFADKYIAETQILFTELRIPELVQYFYQDNP